MIILTIIKWLLIIILIIMAIILCLLLWILISKLTFNIHYQGRQGSNQKVEIRGCYLLGILRYSFVYEKDKNLSYYLKIFFVKILNSDKVKDKDKDFSSGRAKEDELEERVSLQEDIGKEEITPSTDEKRIEVIKSKEDKNFTNYQQTNFEKKDEKEKTSLLEKWENIRNKFCKLGKNLKKNKERYSLS